MSLMGVSNGVKSQGGSYASVFLLLPYRLSFLFSSYSAGIGLHSHPRGARTCNDRPFKSKGHQKEDNQKLGVKYRGLHPNGHRREGVYQQNKRRGTDLRGM